MKKTIITTAVAALTLAAGCGSDQDELAWSDTEEPSAVDNGDVPAMQIAWDTLTPAEQTEVCDSIELAGDEAAYGWFMEGADYSVDVSLGQFRMFFGEVC